MCTCLYTSVDQLRLRDLRPQLLFIWHVKSVDYQIELSKWRGFGPVDRACQRNLWCIMLSINLIKSLAGALSRS